jgi:hypothetical protein
MSRERQEYSVVGLQPGGGYLPGNRQRFAQQINDAVLSLTIESQMLAQGTVYSYTVPTGGYDGAGNLLSYTDSINGTWSMAGWPSFRFWNLG